MNHHALAIALVVSTGACSSWKEPSGSGASARALALQVAKATLDSGRYEILVDQATAAAFAIARTKLEATGRMMTEDQLEQVETVIRESVVAIYPRVLWEEALQKLYFNNLTPDDLRRLLAFQRTRTGRKVLLLQGQLMATADLIRQVMEPRQQAYTERLARSLRAVFRDTLPR